MLVPQGAGDRFAWRLVTPDSPGLPTPSQVRESVGRRLRCPSVESSGEHGASQPRPLSADREQPEPISFATSHPG